MFDRTSAERGTSFPPSFNPRLHGIGQALAQLAVPERDEVIANLLRQLRSVPWDRRVEMKPVVRRRIRGRRVKARRDHLRRLQRLGRSA